jgi:hypothetical protein
VPDVLTWKETSELSALLRTEYEDYLEGSIRQVAAGNEHGMCILESLGLLPREHRRAFLRSPLVASRLVACRTPHQFDSAPVARSLMAELAAAGVAVELSGPTWTALGDRCFDPATPHKSPTRRSVIPGTHITVDGAGPTDFSNGVTGRLALPSRKQRLAVERHLAQAVRIVAEASSSAFQVLDNCIDVVAIRMASDSSKALSSSSFARNPRLILLLYGHLTEHEVPWVTNAIVHETIHSLLLMYEEVEEAFVPRDTDAPYIKISSPWSGNDLFFSNYVHAIIVWYGLYWFWTAAAKANAYAKSSCARMKERARAGFDHRPFSRLSPHARGQLSPMTIDLLRRLERRMLSR